MNDRNKVIYKAEDACKNAAEKIPDHFVELNKMVELGSRSNGNNTIVTIEQISIVQKCFEYTQLYCIFRDHQTAP